MKNNICLHGKINTTAVVFVENDYIKHGRYRIKIGYQNIIIFILEIWLTSHDI